MLRGLVGADTSQGIEQIDGNQGEFTRMGGPTDIPTFFLHAKELKLHPSYPGERMECQAE